MEEGWEEREERQGVKMEICDFDESKGREKRRRGKRMFFE